LFVDEPLIKIMGLSNSKKLLEYAQNVQEKEAMQLLDTSTFIDPNYTNVSFVYRETPLHFACANNMKKLARKLIEHGAYANAKNKFESTPLHIATRMGYQEIVKLLLDDAKCDPNISCACDFRAITIACAVGNIGIVRLLLDHNAFIEDKTLMLATMQEPKESKEPASENKNNSDAIVGLLLDHGANVNSTDKYGNTALMQACLRCNKKIIDVLLSRDWTPKIDLNKQNVYGWSALHFAYAAETEHPKVKSSIIESLLTKGAKTDLKNNDGQIPSDVAPENTINHATKRRRLGNERGHESVTQTCMSDINKVNLLHQFESLGKSENENEDEHENENECKNIKYSHKDPEKTTQSKNLSNGNTVTSARTVSKKKVCYMSEKGNGVILIGTMHNNFLLNKRILTTLFFCDGTLERKTYDHETETTCKKLNCLIRITNEKGE
ncbi:ankyrin repeat protein, partial [Reticulomyxa filosa]